ncbi:hypothetical protein Pmani_033131 [Petrolisthes manimaculis]|uniref:Major facilitator superfamily (MFS) profile domain-containing protein n=1 Tax=Petrolisthes manimaculis TaxID=1843537 RepID=A0AAE1TT07_9EUCA|nr:hypothetical protein Pmani_033131 [Petrolisthes manimaculis]
MYDYDYTTAAHLGYNASLETLSSQGHLITPCNTREFNLTQYKSTIVTQWDLVCERRPLYSSTQAVTLLGLLAGSFVCGIVADLLGRRPLTLISVVGIITLGLATALSPSLQVYIILNFFTSLFIMAFFQTNFLIVIETGSPSSRSTFGVLYGAPWTLGYMALPAVGYFIRDWQWLQVAITLPFFILLVNFWLLPESPRWLIQKGRMVEAIRVLQWAAKSNRRPIPSPPVLMTMLQAVRNKMITDEEETRDGLSGLGEYVCVRGKVLLRRILWLLKTPSLRLNLGVMCVCWFATTMIYYGLALNSTNISVMFFGRRLTLLALYLVCGACISLNAVLMFAFPDVHVSIKMILSLVGKMGVTASFSLLFVYTSELFPTHHRSLALGACGMLGRVGSIISPYVNDILGDVLVWAPSAVFSSVALTAFTLALNLPETRDRILPEEAKFFNTRGATPSGLWTLCKSLKRQVIATTLGAATEGKARRRRESDVGGQCYQYRGHVDL